MRCGPPHSRYSTTARGYRGAPCTVCEERQRQARPADACSSPTSGCPIPTHRQAQARSSRARSRRCLQQATLLVALWRPPWTCAGASVRKRLAPRDVTGLPAGAFLARKGRSKQRCRTLARTLVVLLNRRSRGQVSPPAREGEGGRYTVPVPGPCPWAHSACPHARIAPGT